MKAIDFPERNTIIAKDQPQYFPLPAHIVVGEECRTIFCWKANFWERLQILFTGKIWHHVLTFGNPLQPQLLQVDTPFVKQ